MNRRLIILGALLFSGICELLAQSPSVQFETGLGRLIRHSNQFLFDSDEWTRSFDLSIQWSTDDRTNWAQFYDYPRFGFHFRYHSFGNRTVLGYALGAYPSIHLPLIRKARFGQLDVMVGTGVARVSRPYQIMENPTNTAIGSHWNNLTRIKIQYSRSYRGWRWGLYTDFTHVSNGRLSTPNTGLNTTECGLSLLRSKNKSDSKSAPSSSFAFRKWSLECVAILAGTSQGQFPGPKFPVYVGKFAVIRSLSPVQRLHVGIEWERNMERVHFYRGMLGIANRPEALRYATSYLMYVGDEFVFGPVSLGVVAGIYLQTDINTFPVYNQLFLRYYFLRNGFNSGAFLTVYLKSHVATAQYLGVGVGYQW